jgi:hypothetical protein
MSRFHTPRPPTALNFGVNLVGTYALDKNYTISNDGFGLVTAQFKYTGHASNYLQMENDFKRGSKPPGAKDFENLTLYKVSLSANEAIVTASAEYCGIEGNQSVTTCQVQVNSATGQEAIETHPNFTQVTSPRISTNPLAGPAKVIADNEENLSINPNRAHFALQKSTSKQVVVYAFAGFLPAQKSGDNINIKAGIRSYFKPSVTLRCLVYTNNAELAQETVRRVGWSNKGKFGAIVLPPPYDTLLQKADQDLPVVFVGNPGVSRNYLCTNASVEVYGGLYKIQADLMMSGFIGWDKDIYPSVDQT